MCYSGQGFPSGITISYDISTFQMQSQLTTNKSVRIIILTDLLAAKAEFPSC